jgi:hypothetical protein
VVRDLHFLSNVRNCLSDPVLTDSVEAHLDMVRKFLRNNVYQSVLKF